MDLVKTTFQLKAILKWISIPYDFHDLKDFRLYLK